MTSLAAPTRIFTKKAVKEFAIALAIVVAFMLLASLLSPATAGTDTTFDGLTTMIKDWLEGSAGKFIALLGFGIALASGLIKGSVAGIVFGLGLALSAVYGPNILTGMFSAVL